MNINTELGESCGKARNKKILENYLELLSKISRNESFLMEKPLLYELTFLLKQ